MNSTVSNELNTSDVIPSTSRPIITSRKTSTLLTIPPRLLKPGIEMLKVSAKSARRVKSRKVWLELTNTSCLKKELDLLDIDNIVGEGCIGSNSKRILSQDIRICWEKSTRGVGSNKREASIPLSSLRDLRFGTAGSSYRTSLHLSPLIEPRWLTLIYLQPNNNNSLALLSANTTPSYKLVHFIAPSEEVLELWRSVLDRFREGRVGASLVVAPGGGDSGSEREEDVRVVKEEEVHRLCARLGMGMSKESVGIAFKAVASPNDFLNFAAFQNFVKVLKKRAEMETIFTSLSSSKEGMNAADYKSFLVDTQQSSLSSSAFDNLYLKYRDITTDLISLDGFNSFLISSDNPAIKDDSNQDMTRPLTEYYISSSHNTYLVGNQLRGESTIEGYIRALQQGCRCVELDVWSGEDDSPVITHGRTFTSKISARDALLAISQYGFLASSYPLILSLEIHCDFIQQGKLVEILKETLGERLVVQRIDGSEGELEKLPSPFELRGRVLVKAKDLFSASNNGGGQFLNSLNTSDVEISSATESSPSSDSDFKRAFNAVRRTFDGRSSPRLSSDSSSSSMLPPLTRRSSSIPPLPSPDYSTSSSSSIQNAPKPALSPHLASLLIYTIGVKPRGFNKKETYLPSHILSFGENRLAKMIKDELVKMDFIAHNRGHLTRGYPKGIRVTSTNFEPHHFWAVGVQLVAVNWQTFDLGMELNTALFARAGRSGYVLKPDLLRRKGLEKDKDTLSRVAPFILNLEIISAQQLPRCRDSSITDLESSPMDPFVEISLFIPGIPTPVKRRTKVIAGNAFNPIFHSTFSIPFSFNPSPGMIDLIFLRLEVLNAKGNLRSTSSYTTNGEEAILASGGGKGEFVGAYTIGLGVLLPGYRHLPLYDAVGDQHLFSSLFIKSNVVQLNAK